MARTKSEGQAVNLLRDWNGRLKGDRVESRDVGRGVCQTLVDNNLAEWVKRGRPKRNVQGDKSAID